MIDTQARRLTVKQQFRRGFEIGRSYDANDIAAIIVNLFQEVSAAPTTLARLPEGLRDLADAIETELAR